MTESETTFEHPYRPAAAAVPGLVHRVPWGSLSFITGIVMLMSACTLLGWAGEEDADSLPEFALRIAALSSYLTNVVWVAGIVSLLTEAPVAHRRALWGVLLWIAAMVVLTLYGQIQLDTDMLRP